MSGTSADAVDAALIRIERDPRQLEILAFRSCALPESLRKRIHDLVQAPVSLRDLIQLDIQLGERFAAAVLEVSEAAGVHPSEIEGIGSHGQTVGHFPEREVRGSLQLGSAAVIYERSGIPVISDFRSADLAAGGQGAPLTPFFHAAYFASSSECRAVLNIGGFTNLTFLPAAADEPVIAFDPGPGNALLDRAMRWASEGREAFDRDGAHAREGRVHEEVLESLLEDGYFAASPPKSTGHEYFGERFLAGARERILSEGGTAEDVLATFVALTVESVARQAELFLPRAPERWIVYGGGTWNRTLMERLAQRLAPATLESSDAYGMPVDALEAVAFAVMAWSANQAQTTNLPEATGASRPVVLGSRTPPSAR